MRELPIGVFDSGLGGLTVLDRLVHALPNENFIYLGDIARLPYGNRSPSVVQRYARTCVATLDELGVKAVVIACNTASSAALSYLKETIKLPIFGVIEPGVRAAASHFTSGKRVLVLATNGAVQSEAYPKGFQTLFGFSDVDQQACPLLVPLAEEGWFDSAITEEVMRTYVGSRDLSRYSAIVLGCTHYPLLMKSFQKVVGSVPLVHAGPVMAEELKRWLTDQKLLSSRSMKGTTRLMVTDAVVAPPKFVSDLLGPAARFEHVDIAPLRE